jgi:hypothetical protein
LGPKILQTQIANEVEVEASAPKIVMKADIEYHDMVASMLAGAEDVSSDKKCRHKFFTQNCHFCQFLSTNRFFPIVDVESMVTGKDSIQRRVIIKQWRRGQCIRPHEREIVGSNLARTQRSKEIMSALFSKLLPHTQAGFGLTTHSSADGNHAAKAP